MNSVSNNGMLINSKVNFKAKPGIPKNTKKLIKCIEKNVLQEQKNTQKVQAKISEILENVQNGKISITEAYDETIALLEKVKGFSVIA